MNKKSSFLFVFILSINWFMAAKTIDVYFFPHLLYSTDKLTDGSGQTIDIKESTLLVWVDHQPDYRFVHKTTYILITSTGVRIIKGDWWPVLNGSRILLGNKSKYAITSFFKINSESVSKPTTSNVYIYTHELTSKDILKDGTTSTVFKLGNNTLLVWIDLAPGAKFEHATLYLLISDQSIMVNKGKWWPVLNTKTILYPDYNAVGIISPFVLNVN